MTAPTPAAADLLRKLRRLGEPLVSLVSFLIMLIARHLNKTDDKYAYRLHSPSGMLTIDQQHMHLQNTRRLCRRPSGLCKTNPRACRFSAPASSAQNTRWVSGRAGLVLPAPVRFHISPRSHDMTHLEVRCHWAFLWTASSDRAAGLGRSNYETSANAFFNAIAAASQASSLAICRTAWLNGSALTGPSYPI